MYGPPRTIAEYRTIVQVNKAACVGCGLCARTCPTSKTLEIIGNKAAVVNPSSCGGCYRCISRCPTSALTMNSINRCG